MKEILTHDFGKSFPPAMSFGGYIFIIGGLAAISTNIFLGCILIFFGILVAFSKSGIQIDPNHKTYRSYNYLWGLKQGKWKPLSSYSGMTLLRNKIETSAFSRSNRKAVTSSNSFYEITLLDTSHRNKLCIKRIRDRVIAISDLKELSELLELPVVKYKPHIRKPKLKSIKD